MGRFEILAARQNHTGQKTQNGACHEQSSTPRDSSDSLARSYYHVPEAIGRNVKQPLSKCLVRCYPLPTDRHIGLSVMNHMESGRGTACQVLHTSTSSN